MASVGNTFALENRNYRNYISALRTSSFDCLSALRLRCGPPVGQEHEPGASQRILGVGVLSGLRRRDVGDHRSHAESISDARRGSPVQCLRGLDNRSARPRRGTVGSPGVEAKTIHRLLEFQPETRKVSVSRRDAKFSLKIRAKIQPRKCLQKDPLL